MPIKTCARPGALTAFRVAVPAFTALSIVGVAAPAYADHPGFAGGTGSSGPIITLSASTLPKGEATAGMRLSYLRPDQLSHAELAARAEEHVHAHSPDYLVSPSLTAAYGLTDAFTVSVSLPYVGRHEIRAGTHEYVGGVAVNGVEDLGTSSGLGDAVLLGQYRLIGDEHDPWQVAVVGGVKLPTGALREQDPNGERFETEHQPGTGSWDPLLGLAVTRRFERVTLDVSALYQVSRKGAQQTELGDRLQYGVALSYRLGEAPRHHDHGEAAHHHDDKHGAAAVDLVLELNGEWEGRQRVAGETGEESGGHVLYLSPGVRVTPAKGWSASVSLSVPVVQDIRLSHPENNYRLVAGVARSF